ncbi:hypothetical protein Mgra_00005808, partial [Meloidogyne graminicola]
GVRFFTGDPSTALWHWDKWFGFKDFLQLDLIFWWEQPWIMVNICNGNYWDYNIF